MKIQVVLADDHPLIMVGATQLLKSEMNIEVTATAVSPEKLMEVLASGPCDVLVTDFSMPKEQGADGLVMLSAIRSRFPEVRIVVLTMLDNVGLLQRMRRVGALGVLNKRGDMAELPDAIMTVYRHRPFLGKSVRVQMLEAGIGPQGPEQSLSPRELEIIRLYVGGASITEIAKSLNRTLNTISTQKSSAMRKLGVKNDTELYHYASLVGLT